MFVLLPLQFVFFRGCMYRVIEQERREQLQPISIQDCKHPFKKKEMLEGAELQTNLDTSVHALAESWWVHMRCITD